MTVRVKKAKVKRINWSAYNKELVRRGSITFWFPVGIAEHWYDVTSSGKGFLRVYTDMAIQILSMVRFQYNLTLRGTQGFAESLTKLIPELSGLNIPDYSTLCRRLQKSKVDMGKIRKKASKENIHVVIDSTGLKVFGEGEWKVRQHGYSKRRTWKKLHLAVDEKNSAIVSVSLTECSFKDNELLPDMLNGLEGEVSRVSGDGAYDAKNCWDFCRDKGIEGIFPPRRGAKIRTHGNSKVSDPPSLDRDNHIRMLRRMGKRRWKLESGYSRRSIAETAMQRFKMLFGDRLSSREFARQANEVFIKCKMLNKMAVPKVL